MRILSDQASTFFEELEQRGHEPLLEKAQGTLRFDLTNGKNSEHWLVAFDKGDVSVSRRNRKADCGFTTDRALFGRIVRGEANAITAVLRGEATAEGDLELLFLLQRIFPTPAQPRKAEKQPAAGGMRG